MSESAPDGAAATVGPGPGPGPSPVAASSTAESPAAQKSSAAKDRNCPYCGQAFTSSSLGRHLDLYIKDKNPKPPDGIHDVDAIRLMRKTITRRQPRSSIARRETSTPGTPGSIVRRSPGPEAAIKPPAIPKEGQYVVDHQTVHYPFQPSWEATGVINNLPPPTSDPSHGGSSAWGNPRASGTASPARDLPRPPNSQRASSRTAQRAQLDAKQKLSDAVDTARAAELALRELLSSMRAAKQHVDMNSLPFDFEPLALDFPALTLQCLKAPPTLFSSTPHPNSTSWSIQPPGQKQYEALQMYFQEEFRKWRVSCATATTTSSDDLTYPPSDTHFPRDMREGVKKAERNAALLEKQVNEHLQSTYHVWEQLSPQRRNELWGLELARSVGRRQKELEKLKEVHYATNQENTNLKIQIDHLNRLQQPREFRIVPPATIPIEESIMNYLLSLGAGGKRGVGFTVDERHVDLGTMVTRAIDRWKTVVVASRGSGMGGQKPLDQPTSTTPVSATAPIALPPHHRPPLLATAPSSSTPASVAVDEETSDLDADAEMDEESSFTPVLPTVVNTSSQSQPQSKPDVSRTKNADNRNVNGTNTRPTPGKSSGVNKRVSTRRCNPAQSTISKGLAQHGLSGKDNYTATSNQEAVDDDEDDAMYMD
ncbi:hypothetical protein GGS20DRAFT_549607 [Poronia punctata]|nr:hypothetical protein GGS20DRAFT_549607 [Poronia punctata]